MIVYRFAQELKNKYRFDWMTYSLTGNDWAYMFEQMGSVIQFFPGPKGLRHIISDFCLYAKYIKFIRDNHYTVVHVHTEKPTAVRFVIVSYLAGAKKRILHSHSNSAIGVSNNLRTKLSKWLMRIFVTDYVACSQEAADWLFPPKGAENAVILKNGLDTGLYRFNLETRKTIRRKLGLEDNQYVIGHIGKFAPQKNHMFLLEAFRNVLSIDSGARLMLLGSGPMDAEIHERMKLLEIDEQVIDIGQVDNVQDYLNAMDVMALPSLYEGLGMVNIEAQTNGLPCVVSNRVAKLAKVTDILEFYPLEDGADNWAKYLLQFKRNNINRESYCDKVRKSGWDIKDIAGKLRELYDF